MTRFYKEIVLKTMSNSRLKGFQDLNWLINDIFILVIRHCHCPLLRFQNTAHLLHYDFLLWQLHEKAAFLDRLQVLPQAQRASVVSELQLYGGGVGNTGPRRHSPRPGLRRKVLTLPTLLNLLLLWGVPVFLVEERWRSNERSYGKGLGVVLRLLTLNFRTV